MGKREKLTIYYDGSCPFCSNYVHLLDLKIEYEVALVNLRGKPDLLGRFKSLDLDVNEGMIVETNSELFYAEDAITLLAELDKSKALYSNFVNMFFKIGYFHSFIYGLFKMFRRIVLKVMNIDMIK